MKKLPGRFIKLIFFSFILILVTLSQPVSAAEPTSTPVPSGSPQAEASVTPSVSPKSSPTASSSPATTAATPAATSSPTESQSGGNDKKSEVLGSTDVLGATGTEREIAKWMFVLGTGFFVFMIGFKISRKVNRADEE